MHDECTICKKGHALINVCALHWMEALPITEVNNFITQQYCKLTFLLRMQHCYCGNIIVMYLYCYVSSTMCMFITHVCNMHHHGSGRHKGQKLVDCFLKIEYF